MSKISNRKASLQLVFSQQLQLGDAVTLLRRPSLAVHKPIVNPVIQSNITVRNLPSVHKWRAGTHSYHFTDDIFKCNYCVWFFFISIRIALRVVLNGLTHNQTTFVQMMAWSLTNAKPLSTRMMAMMVHNLPTQKLFRWMKVLAWSFSMPPIMFTACS